METRIPWKIVLEAWFIKTKRNIFEIQYHSENRLYNDDLVSKHVYKWGIQSVTVCL